MVELINSLRDEESQKSLSFNQKKSKLEKTVNQLGEHKKKLKDFPFFKSQIQLAQGKSFKDQTIIDTIDKMVLDLKSSLIESHQQMDQNL